MSDDHEIIPAEAVEIVDADYVEILHPLVRSMQSQGGMTPENIERMMDLQERYESGLTKKAFDTARDRLEDDLPDVIPTNKDVNFLGTHYSYADLPQIKKYVTPHLRAHGFRTRWSSDSDGRDEIITCILSHRDGHYEKNTMRGAVEPRKGQSMAQSAQSIRTYLKRHTLLDILGLPYENMPDADERPKPSPTTVDENRNLRALAKLRREHGIDVEEAEEYLGRVSDWTAADIARIPAWLESRKEEGE